MPRLKPVSRDKADPRVIPVYDLVFGADRDPVASPGTATGTPGDFFTTWANAPAILAHFQTLMPNASAASAPQASQVDAALRGLAACRVGYTLRSQFVYSQNCKASRNAGVPEEKIQAVSCWTLSTLFTDIERAVLAYVDANILERGRVHDDVIAGLRKTLSEEQIIGLSFTINFYAMHARSCRALRLEYDDVPERLTEIPAPDKPGVQDWR
ncbi:MAG: carboxymuconolactone decarboxylase family protein [Phenylobacterium sp.]|nr:carboxymuconolactone decarboxylase family protein [Phenylobacterium sp.]